MTAQAPFTSPTAGILDAPLVPAKVVIVDDMLPNALLAAVVVERLDGVEVEVFEDAPEALARCRAAPPDLVLLDYVMPGLDGIAFARALRDGLDGEFVPIIMVTGESRSGTLAEAMAAGATDFLRKPWDETELEARARNMLSLRRSYLELRRKTQALHVLATTDPLTGILNRRAFSEAATGEVDRVRRYGRPASLLMMDIDFFKRINDGWGHAAGDAVLCAFADHCREHLRDTDHLGRLGGEEFAVLLPETDAAGAQILAERLRADLAAVRVTPADGPPIAMTVSIGVAEAGPDESLDGLLRRADAALYAAKEAGRDRVLLADARAADGVA